MSKLFWAMLSLYPIPIPTNMIDIIVNIAIIFLVKHIQLDALTE